VTSQNKGVLGVNGETEAPAPPEAENRRPVPAPDVKIARVAPAIPQADGDTRAPARPEPERGRAVAAPEAKSAAVIAVPSADRIVPAGQAAPKESPAQQRAALAPEPPQPMVERESPAPFRTQTAFGARLVPAPPRCQHDGAESARPQV